MRRALVGTALAALFLALAPARAAAQQGPGRIVGRVIDGGTGRGIAGAQVSVPGTALRATAGVDGRYALSGVPAGTHSVAASFLGYGPKTVTGVSVPSGGAAELDVTLSAQSLAIEGVTVTAARERGSVARALDEQRTAVGVVSSVTAEQITKSPDADAAQAVQRVSGVTVQDGRYVVVRGLGERYTTTSLNGARIPSPEPERRMVPLDLFPAGLLQSITTAKTFTPDQPGDFSGAQVNLRTREFPARGTFTASLSTGFNSAVTGSALPVAPAAGGEWLAAAGGERGVPAEVLAAGGFQGSLTPEEMNRLARSFRNVWSPRESEGKPNVSGGFSLGGTAPVLRRELGYLLSGTYSQSHEALADQRRATTIAGESAEPEVDASFAGSTGRVSVLWGGLANLSTRFGEGHRLSLNNSYNRSADNEARTETGSSENLADLPLTLQRLRYVERSVRSSQLAGEHLLGSRHRVDWSVTASGVTRSEPDRSDVVYVSETDPATGDVLAPAWYAGSNEVAVRTFAELDERSVEGAANWQVELGRGGAHRLKLGGLYRATDRDADNFAYSISGFGIPRDARTLSPEEIFDGRWAQGTDQFLRVTPLAQGGSYTAAEQVAAGYAMAEIAATERIRVVGGARLEHGTLELDALSTNGDATHVEPRYTDVLPSLAINVALTDAVNLRLSASRTLSRPEYREMAPIIYPDVVGSEKVRGNPELRRALIDNLDARWEWYPNAGEVLSVGVFAKRFHDPVERVYLATSGTALVTFVNADAAENYGVEVEARKELGTLAAWLEPLTVFANATVMRSRIRIGDSISSRTNDDRPMVGQAPYVVNAGVTWAALDGGASATLLYNVVGERIVSAAVSPLPDVYEQPRHVLDLSLRFPLRRGLEARLDGKNLLDEPYEVRQGDIVREFYRTGRSLGLGVSVRR